MPQGKGKSPTKAVDSLSDNNPKELTDNQRLEERSDGSVWLVESFTYPEGKFGPDSKERRVDSTADLNHAAKGGKVWYRVLLAEQKKADEAAKAPKTARKPKPKTEKKDDE